MIRELTDRELDAVCGGSKRDNGGQSIDKSNTGGNIVITNGNKDSWVFVNVNTGNQQV